MDGTSSPDYKALFLKAEEGRRQERERNRPTTFGAFIRHCHDLLCGRYELKHLLAPQARFPLLPENACPLRLRPWADCEARQQGIYKSICRYLQPTDEDARQLFAPLVALEDHSRRFARRPISSERDLETYERLAVEDHVHHIVAELCKIPNAREEFQLGSGVRFDNHANYLDEDDGRDATARPSRPDQFCIHQSTLSVGACVKDSDRWISGEKSSNPILFLRKSQRDQGITPRGWSDQRLLSTCVGE
ncbi:hypothetical protein ACJ73_06382 [Blastomyces percursus]|uniref:Uncharacterized protein n=1 Tax=Blastomyces percursus TaxID=1658174 RepID=A0A1J9Q130_9EURO|nr:hypothetical protein ACJ73_06382 [Blastomyces percursus]